jgi:hypothetical protein
MWLFWFAIFILFLLVSLGSLREGMTSSQLATLQGVLISSASPNDKLAQLFGDSAIVTIEDEELVAIFKSSLDPEEKINNIKLFISSLVDSRNNDPDSIYLKTPDKISTDKFIKLNNILNSNDDDSDRILLINDLDINESTFTNILNNNSISDSVKLFGDPERVYVGPSISSLVNQILFKTFDSPIKPPPPK